MKRSLLNHRIVSQAYRAGLLLMMILFLGSETGIAQTFEKEDYDSRRIQGSLQNSRNSSRFAKQNKTAMEGNSQYRQIAMMDGNLATGPFTNSGVISYGGVGDDLRVGWPKGSLRADYVWGAFFFVGGEVVDDSGQVIHIISDNIPNEQDPGGTHEYAFMPIPGYYNLDIPGSFEDPLIGGVSEDVGIDGIANSGDEGEGDGELQPAEDFNGNGVLDLNLQNGVGWYALSSRRETWPEYWPAGSYPGDDRQIGEERPGVRANRWNGEFGAYFRADQEIYFIMDDRENDEFEYYPFPENRGSWPNGRRGLGVKVEARTYQWNARLAEDIMICIYDITSEGLDIPTSVVGMYVDPDLGGPPTNDDALFDDIDDITYAWNKLGISNNGIPLGYFGFAFLESPGLGSDGIDNDQDGLIDESQSNGIDDDGDWTTWEDENLNGTYDTEDLNYNGFLDAGEDANGNGRLDVEPLNDDVGSDGLGPQNFEYTGPDPDGTEANNMPDPGEPNFEFTDNDESDQVGLTSFYLRSTQDQNGYGGRNDEYYWDREVHPDTFRTVPGYQQDISFSYGSGYIQFGGEETTHRYAIALVFGNNFEDILRNKRTMQNIYDNDYNFAKPPRQPVLSAIPDDKRVFLEWDAGAERSLDPIYGRDFEAYYIYKSVDPTFTEIKTITDGFGNPFLFKSIAVYDKIDGLVGLHPVTIGSEIGPESDLGVTYNMGTDSGLEHRYVDTDVINGRTYYYAVSSVDQGYYEDFFDRGISEKADLLNISPTESPVNIQVDPLGRPISFDPNTIQVIPTELVAGWVEPSVSDAGIEHVSGVGTGNIEIQIFSPLEVVNGNRYRVEFNDDGRFEGLDSASYTGLTSQMTISSISDNVTLLTENDPENAVIDERFIFDGFRVLLHNDTNSVDTSKSSWTSGSSPINGLGVNSGSSGSDVARDYEVRVLEAGADTSFNRRPVNFQLWDVTDSENEFKLEFIFTDQNEQGILDHNDRISSFIRTPGISRLWTFEFKFPETLDSSLWVAPQTGDVYKFITKKNFNRNDAFEFTMSGNIISDVMAENELDDIYVVPDPYIAVNPVERKVLNPEEGRGDRKLDFVNLPQECTIKIFTVSGKLVQTITHSSSEDNRRASWDLRTVDGLEISHGMYFYVVDAGTLGTKTGKFAVIK